MQIAAGEFKAKCLKLMDRIKKNHEEIIITKYGKPIAKLIPFTEKPAKSMFGCMKGTIEITGDIVSPLDIKWDANED